MGKARIVVIVGQASVRKTLEAGVDADKDATAMAVRFLLQLLADQAPGTALEVRVPPFGAVQCVEGPAHTRGTPPNVVEMDAATWLALATGAEQWDAALADHRISASGARANLSEQLPLRWENPAA